MKRNAFHMKKITRKDFQIKLELVLQHDFKNILAIYINITDFLSKIIFFFALSIRSCTKIVIYH